MGAKDGLRDGDEQVVDQRALVALEVGMGLFLDEDEQVAADAVVRTSVALAAHGELHTFAHAGRDVDFDDFITFHDTLAAAMGAFLFDDGACAITGGANGSGLHLSEERVDSLHHLTTAMAGRAGLGGAVLRAAAVAMRASHIFTHFDFLLRAVGNLLKVQLHFHAKVGTTLLDGAATAATTSEATETAEAAATKVEAATKHAVQDVVQVEVAEAAKAAATAGGATIHAGEAITVVTRFLVGIAQHGIGLRGFLEVLLGGFLLGVGAVHPLVRVPFQGSLTVGAFYFVGR